MKSNNFPRQNLVRRMAIFANLFSVWSKGAQLDPHIGMSFSLLCYVVLFEV